MAYNQAVVLAGGIAHIPVLITVLKFLDSKTLKLHNKKAAVQAKEKEAAEKVAAAAKLAKERAAAEAAKLAAEVQAKSAQAPADPSDN